MKEWLKKRAGEKSTWYGLGTFITSLGMLLKADHVPEIGEIVAQSADSLSAGDYATPVATAVMGVLAILTADKGNK